MKAVATLLAVLYVLSIGSFAFAQAASAVERQAAMPAVIIQLEDEINDYTRDDLIRRFKEARESGAKAIILEIDSYGGSALAGLETSRFIKQQDIPVTVFIKEKAISAGALIAVACNNIWMAPHSFIGDAGVIAISSEGMQPLGATERAKAESPVVEDFRDSAKRNGYSPLLLESMVVVGREVYYVKSPTGEKRFVDGDEYTKLRNEGWEPVIPDRNPIDSRESLLTLNADVAEKVGLAKGIALSADEVASKCNYHIIGRFDRTAGDRLIALLSSSAVRGLLITGLVICIYLAFKIPGAGLAEAGIAVCLGLLLGVPLLTGYASWWEIILVLAGVVLLALEIFVVPGTAIPGFAGVLCIVVGLVLTFIPKQPVSVPGILPSMPATWEGLQRGLLVMGVSMAVALVGCGFIARFLPAMPLFNRLVLTKTVGGGRGDETKVADAPDAVAAIAWVKVGDEGEALTDLRPGGTARFHDPALGAPRATDVICDSGFIPAKTKVIVHELLGSTVVVRRAS